MRKTALQIAQELQTGELALRSYIEETIAGIEADEHNAFLHTTPPTELKLTGDCPLSGVAVAVADNILAKGELGTAGSQMLHNFIPPYGATVLDKLAAAGLVQVGRSNLPEFGMGTAGTDANFGPILNPHNPERVSEGAAAAVAAGLVPLALSVDATGNARKMAAMTGVVCLKPSYGAVSRFGVVPYIESSEVVAVTADNMADAASLFNIIAGSDAKDGTCYEQDMPPLSLDNPGIAGLKIALPSQYFGEELDAENRAAIEGFCAKLRKLGAEVTEVDLPQAEQAHLALQIMAAAEGANNLSRYDGVKYGYQSEQNRTLEEIYFHSRSEAFQVEAKRTAILGSYLLAQGNYERYYLKALQIRRQCAEAVQALFSAYDLILTPPCRGVAYELKEAAAYYQEDWLNSKYTALATITGLPAAVLPLGLNCQGLPVGVQLIAGALQEQKLVNLALACEL